MSCQTCLFIIGAVLSPLPLNMAISGHSTILQGYECFPQPDFEGIPQGFWQMKGLDRKAAVLGTSAVSVDHRLARGSLAPMRASSDTGLGIRSSDLHSLWVMMLQNWTFHRANSPCPLLPFHPSCSVASASSNFGAQPSTSQPYMAQV